MKKCGFYSSGLNDPKLAGYCMGGREFDAQYCGGHFEKCAKLREPKVKRLVAESMAEEIKGCVPDRSNKEQIVAELGQRLPDVIERLYQTDKDCVQIAGNPLVTKRDMQLSTEVSSISCDIFWMEENDSKRSDITKGVRRILEEYSPIILKMHRKA